MTIGILAIASNTYLNIKWDMDHKNWELKHSNMLKKAIENNNITQCNDYKYKLGCVVLIGQNLENESVCEEAYEESFVRYACKGAVLGSKSSCAENPNEKELWACKTMYDSIQSTLSESEYKIAEKNSKNMLIINQAVKEMNVSLCKNTTFEAACTVIVAQKHNNKSLCREMYNDSFMGDACISIVSDNRNLCSEKYPNNEMAVWVCQENYNLIVKELNIIA